MPITLSPRIYRSNMQWTVMPRNKIDTICIQPIKNTLEDTTEIHTEKFDTANIGSTTYTLPISNSTTIAPTYYRYMQNKYLESLIMGQQEYAKARTECIIATNSRTIELQDPIYGTPTVTIELKGKSSIINHGQKTYAEYPTYDNLSLSSYNLASWIENNKNNTANNLTWIYEDNKFSMNPWVKNIKPIDQFDYTDITDADIYTKWFNGIFSHYQADSNAWTDNANYNYLGPKFHMYPVTPEPPPQAVIPPWITMHDSNISIQVTIQRLSSRRFTISWRAPIRFAYAAASRSSYFGNHETDSWAFVDNITEVDISLFGIPYNTDTENVQYSLDTQGNLTPNVINNYPLRFDKNELITLKTYKGTEDNLYTEWMSKELLTKYKNGKYIIKCDVPIEWIFTNNIQINTEMYIQLQNGSFITRNNQKVVFRVKNMEKQFAADKFICSLQLMEV